MSAFFSFRYPDRVQVLTDGAWLAPDGRLLCVDRKILTFPNHKLAMTGRGTDARQVFEVVQKSLFIAETEAVGRTVDELLDMVQLLFDVLSERGLFDAEFLIAAWSESRGAVHFFVPCHRNRPEPEPFQFHAMGAQICAGPKVVWDDLKHLNLPPSAINEPEFPALHGAEIMSIMRSRPDLVPGADLPRHVIGGHCELTTVAASGVTSKILCRWDEPINAPIDPRNRRVA